MNMRQNVLGIPVYGNGSSSCKRVIGRSFLSEFLQDDSTTKHALSHRLLQTRFLRHTILAIPFLLKTLKCLLSRIPYRSIVATTTDIRIGNATLLKFLVSSTCEGCVTVSLSLPLWCCWLSLSPKERISSLVCCHTRFFRYSVNMHGLFND